MRVGWPGPNPAYPIGPTRTNHPWRPTAPGPLYRPDACQPPWPTLSGGRVPTVLAYPIGPTRAVGLHRSSGSPPPAFIERAVLEHTNVALVFTALSATRRGSSGLQGTRARTRSRYIQVN